MLKNFKLMDCFFTKTRYLFLCVSRRKLISGYLTKVEYKSFRRTKQNFEIWTFRLKTKFYGAGLEAEFFVPKITWVSKGIISTQDNKMKIKTANFSFIFIFENCGCCFGSQMCVFQKLFFFTNFIKKVII